MFRIAELYSSSRIQPLATCRKKIPRPLGYLDLLSSCQVTVFLKLSGS